MYFIAERVQRQCDELKKLVVTQRLPVNGIQIRWGEVPKGTALASVGDAFEEFTMGETWSRGGSEDYALFRFTVQIPECMRGKRVFLFVRTNKTGWNAINPQMLVCIDGQEYQGLDTNHLNVLLDEHACPGREYSVHLYAFSGIYLADEGRTCENDVRLYVHIDASDEQIEALYYDIAAPLQYVVYHPGQDFGKIRMLDTLNDAVNLIDFRSPYSDTFYASISASRSYLRETLYEKVNDNGTRCTCVGHTHIDVGWLWRYCHTRDKTVRSFTTALRLMEQYPEFVFMSSQPQLYEYIKNDYPEVFEQIRSRIKEGRWEAEGGMWVEADTNVPSGESLVRQILFGKRFFKTEFDVESRILWLPDVFGYSAALPQILKKSGIDYFMTAKLWNNEINRFPYDTFLWKGIDGTEILTHLLTYAPNAYNSIIQKADIAVAWDNYKQKDINDDILISFGYGDGGGGPTREMLEILRRLENGLPGCPSVKIGSAASYFANLEKRVSNNRRLPKWVGELYYELHRGTYTTMARNKRMNRRSEILFTSAEWLSVFSGLLTGSAYPALELHDGWKDILLNQFHDVLPGSSVKEVYQDTDEIYGRVGATGKRIVDECMRGISESIALPDESIIVFNALSWNRDGTVEFEYPAAGSDIQLMSENGNALRCQRVNGCDNQWISALKGVASKGYSPYTVRRCAQQPEKLPFHARDGVFENRFFRLVLTQDGSFSSIYDLTLGREILPQGEHGNVLQAFEDKPRKEDNWNLDIFYSEKQYPIESPYSVEIVEEGPVRMVLRIKRRFVNSEISQDVILYADIRRIDFQTRIDWKEKDIVLKTAFPVNVNTDKATYEVQYGFVQRNTHWNTSWDIAKFEVCGHKWADLSEDGYGVSLLNDCKYGYDIKDGRMRLTLLRSGTTPNTDADREIHTFCYSLYPHAGSWQDAATISQAYDLNYPLLARVSGPHKGDFHGSLSFVGLNCQNVIAEVVKQAEDSRDMIIRVYEAYNRRSAVEMRFCREIQEITECDLMENALQDDDVRHEGAVACFDIKPFEIKTFRFRLQS